MTVSDLKGLRACHSKIRSLQQRVDRLRCAMYSPSNPVLSHTPKGGDKSDPTAKAAITIAEMELRLLDMIVSMETQIETVEREISRMSKRDQNILRARYIDGMTWRNVAKACHYNKDHCMRIHKQILTKLEKDAVKSRK